MPKRGDGRLNTKPTGPIGWICVISGNADDSSVWCEYHTPLELMKLRQLVLDQDTMDMLNKPTHEKPA